MGVFVLFKIVDIINGLAEKIAVALLIGNFATLHFQSEPLNHFQLAEKLEALHKIYEFMQLRMKTHQLTMEQVSQLLQECKSGSLATVGADNAPYVTPIHYVYLDGKIYFHGLPKGQKLSNIITNPLVSFNVYNMVGLLFDENGKPCDTNTEYQSVIVNGSASLVSNIDMKKSVLEAIIAKYTPQLSDKELPDNMVKGTAVVEIEITEVTGKYWN